MAVAIAEVLTYANGTAAEPTASLGAGSAVDDYCVAALSVLTTVTPAAASGWGEESVTNNTVSTLCQTRIYTFRLTAGGTQSHAFDRNGSSRWSLAVVRMTGVDTTTAVDAGDQTGTGTAAETHTSPSVACDSGNLALGFASMRVFPNNSWTLTAGGFSEDADFRGTDASTNFRIGVFSKQSTGASEQYTVATGAGDGEPALKALFEIVAAAGGAIEEDINTATETDTATAVGKTKARTAGLTTETDAAPALGRSKVRAAGLAGETNSATALGRAKARTLGVAAETDASQTFARSKARAAGLAATTGEALPISPSSASTLGLASETDSAFVVGRVKARTLGVATETDTAIAIAGADVRDLVLTLGPVETKWHAGQPDLKWRTEGPEVKWSTGLVEV